MKINIIDQIENIFGNLSAENLINSGYTRVNGSDINLNIKAGTAFITPDSDAILVIGNPYSFLAALSEKQKAPFKYSELMLVQMGNQRVSIYLAEAEIIADCIKYYADITLPEIASHDNPAQLS